MTIKHIAMVLEADGLDGAERLLLLAYCNRTDDHGCCWPGQQRLADDCGASPATVKRVKKKLVGKRLIASVRRVDPRTGEPISNLTRVNPELLAAMKRKRTDYDDNVIEQLTFAAGTPLPTKRKKTAKGTVRGADRLMAQDEPDPGLKMSPTPVQVEPEVGFDLNPASGRVEPLSISDPPEKPQGTVLPSVGSRPAPRRGGGTDGKKPPEAVVSPTEGVRFPQSLGSAHPKLMLTGKPLRDQGLVVDELFRLGWKDGVLWELLIRPLPTPLRRGVSTVLAKRLSDALVSSGARPSPRVGGRPGDTGPSAARRWCGPRDPPQVRVPGGPRAVRGARAGGGRLVPQVCADAGTGVVTADGRRAPRRWLAVQALVPALVEGVGRPSLLLAVPGFRR